MKNLLVGNGINIEFDNNNYTTESIVLRILKNCDRDDFPTHIIVDYPYLLKNYLGLLFIEAREAIRGEYDKYALSSSERRSLDVFKERYFSRLNTLKMTQIGFEDYYLIHDLACHKSQTYNPDQFYAREGMRIAYLYSIFNDGKLELLHKEYPQTLVDELLSYDKIFTTNYDSNIEYATGKDIFHIHGAFAQKSDVYVASSLRNQLPDAPLNDIVIDEEYYYLYSNAITTYSGDYKQYQINQYSMANSCINKMAESYTSDPSIQAEVKKWCDNSNRLTRNLGYAIKVKVEHPELSFSENYHFDELKKMEGELFVLGLSPWNDFHIFESIDATNITRCTFWYYNEEECEEVKKLLPTINRDNKLEFKNVKEFWKDIYG